MTWLDKLLKKFNKEYNLDGISILTLDDYVLGKGKDTFCCFIEYQSERLGDIKGSYPAMKYKIYYSKEGKYKRKKNSSFGNNENEIFNNVKDSLFNLVVAINNYDDRSFELNRLNPLFKNKLEYLYNYEESLPIYSESDVEIILNLLDIKFNRLDTRINKRRKLYKFYKDLNIDNCSPISFMNFIYSNSFDLKSIKKKFKLDNLNSKNIKNTKYIIKTITDITTLNNNPTYEGNSDYKEVSNAELKIIGSYGEDKVINI